MLQMIRTAAETTIRAVAAIAKAPRTSPYINYMLYKNGKQFMVINAPSLDHAQFIVAGFPAEFTWMLVEQES